MKPTRRMAAWKRLLKKYPDSVWRVEAALQVIDVLYATKDYASCMPYCRQVVRGTTDSGSIAEARYVGAYCLNALSQYDDAKSWMDRWFSAEDATEAGWRRGLRPASVAFGPC